MVSFYPAVEKTLANEGGFYHDLVTGEVVNYGITVNFLRSIGVLPPNDGPAQDFEIEFVRSMTRSYAKALYGAYFWMDGHFDLLENQAVADKVFDVGVNTGLEESIRFLQQAMNDAPFFAQLKIDGSLGPKTARAVNAANPEMVLENFRTVAAAYYRNLAETKPVLYKGKLAGWLDRLAKV